MERKTILTFCVGGRALYCFKGLVKCHGILKHLHKGKGKQVFYTVVWILRNSALPYFTESAFVCQYSFCVNHRIFISPLLFTINAPSFYLFTGEQSQTNTIQKCSLVNEFLLHHVGHYYPTRIMQGVLRKVMQEANKTMTP
jgi:hypothetical protein